MKKELSVNDFLTNTTNLKNNMKTGESYATILRYFIPEFITALLLYSVPVWLDAYFIGQLHSTTNYNTLSLTNDLIHMIIKFAEAFSVGAMVLCGQLNGMQAYKEVGRALRDSFWVTIVSGALVSACLYFGAPAIYYWYDVPQTVISRGVPFLQLRALGIFFTFVYLALFGFMRGIKNTKTPMHIFVAGSLLFILLDYALILGKLGAPVLGLLGSAVASIVQSAFMAFLALLYVIKSKETRQYFVDLFNYAYWPAYVLDIIKLSIPVAIDKVTFAMSYIWLGKMAAPISKYALASFCVVRQMDRFAFLPAIACAQIITFLISNDLGARNWPGMQANIKRVLWLSSFFVFVILTMFVVWPRQIISLFDQKGAFTDLAARIFPMLSILNFLDLLQLILSGALRGMRDVKAVMYTRLIIILGFFMPLSYAISKLSTESEVVQLALLYGAFYAGTGLMSIVYLWRIRKLIYNPSTYEESR